MHDDEKLKYRWDSFAKYCEDDGISLEYEEDWSSWWDCWKTAIDTVIVKEDQ